MLMQALRPWINRDHEGVVHTGDQFEAAPLRARELEAAGLAIPAMSDTVKTLVTADVVVETVEVATKPTPRAKERAVKQG